MKHQRPLIVFLLSAFVFTISRNAVLSAPAAQPAGPVVDVMTQADWEEMVKLQEWVWHQELNDKIDAWEKAALDAVAKINAGATPEQKALFDRLMESVGDKWSMNAPPGEFPAEQAGRLTDAQQKAFQNAYDDAARNAAEEAEKELQKVAGEVTKKVGGLAGGAEAGSKTVIKPPGTLVGEGAGGEATVIRVVESEGKALAGGAAKTAGLGITRKGLTAAAAKIAATTIGKTILKIIPVLDTAATTIEFGTEISDTLEEAVMTNIHAVDKLEKFLGALLQQEGSLLKELQQLNAPEVLQAEQALAEAEAQLPEIEKALGKNNPQLKDLKRKIAAAKKARDANEKRRKEIERQLKKIDELKKKTRKEIDEAEKKTGLIDVVVPVAVDTVKGIPGTVKDFINWISSPFSSPSANPPPPAEVHGPSTVIEIPPPVKNPDEVQLINMEIRALEGLRDRAKNAKDRKEAQDQIDDAKAVRARVIEKQNKKYKEEHAKREEQKNKKSTIVVAPKVSKTTPPKEKEKTVQTEDGKTPNAGAGAGGGVGIGGGAGAGGGGLNGDIVCAMENVKRITNAGSTYVRDANAPKGIRAIPGKDLPTINASERAWFKFYTLAPAVSVEPNFTWSQSATQYDVPKVGRKDPDPKQKNRLILSTTECQVGVHGLMTVSFDQTVFVTRGAKDGTLITKGTCSLNVDCGGVATDGGGGGKDSDYTVRPEPEAYTALAILPQQFTADVDGHYTGIGLDATAWAKLMTAKPSAIRYSTESGQHGITTDLTDGIIATDSPLKKDDALYLSVLFKNTTVNDLKDALGIKDQSGGNNPLWVWGIGDGKTLQKTNKASHFVPFVGNDPNEPPRIVPTLQRLDTFTVQRDDDGTYTITAVVKPSLFGRALDSVRLMAHLPSGYKTFSAKTMTFSTESGPKTLSQTSGSAEGVTTEALKEELMTLTAAGIPADQAQDLAAGTYITFQAYSSTNSNVLPASKGIEWTE